MTYITFAERHGMEKGLKQGLEQGREEGREEGLEQGKLAVAARLLKAGFELTAVKEMTGLPIEKIKLFQNTQEKVN